jgi:two-component system, OmpR family, response regulator CpxR
MSRILLIDDDIDLCELLCEYLASEGLTVESVHEGEEGTRRALSGEYALVILDVMLPSMSGFDVLRRIRAGTSLPVLMLTARGDDIDRIVGLEMGADDYLPKPFNSRELTARIRAILRRTRQEAGEAPAKKPSASKLMVGDVELNPSTLEVLCDKEPVDLTAVEFKLLEVLLRSAGVVIAREDLTKEVLGRELTAYDRSIDVHVSKLRKKLGPAGNGMERIRSVRNAGYIYVLHSGSVSRENS